MKKVFLEIGEIVGTCGLRGEVKIVPWCDGFSVFSGLSRLFFDSDGNICKNIENSRQRKSLVVVKFFGVDSLESAKQMLKSVVYARRDDILVPDGRHFIQDLVGMRVYDVGDGAFYGRIVDVLQPGANDVYRIVDDQGVERLVPVIDDVVLRTDFERGSVYIRPLEGLFDA